MSFVLVTTFKAGPAAPHRKEVFGEFLRAVAQYRVPSVVMYNNVSDIAHYRQYKHIQFFPQSSPYGLGFAVAEAMKAASSLFPEHSHFIWCEPEKPDMVRVLATHAHELRHTHAPLIIFNRSHYYNYPLAQHLHYRLARLLFKLRFKKDADIAFGPFGLRRDVLFDYFETPYRKWSRYIAPRKDYLRRGEALVINVNFINHPTMYRAERWNLHYMKKRAKQSLHLLKDVHTKTHTTS